VQRGLRGGRAREGERADRNCEGQGMDGEVPAHRNSPLKVALSMATASPQVPLQRHFRRVTAALQGVADFPHTFLWAFSEDYSGKESM
jgi:hypothetical protein